jgi:hypothetical protein
MIITARYPSICTNCPNPINVGDQIHWERAVRGVRHVSCALAEAGAQTVRAQPAPPPVVDVSGIVAFLQQAKDNGLKFPKARFLSPERTEMRLSIARARFGSRVPEGAMTIRIGDAYHGFVQPDGKCIGHVASNVPLQELLVAIGEDPAGAARAYGALMGRCSFCNLPITDAGSVEVGYGPICASSYNLPWVRLGVPELTAIPEVEGSRLGQASPVRPDPGPALRSTERP